MARLAVLLVLLAADTEEVRVWEDVTGNHSAKATFLRLDAPSQSVCLSLPSGKEVRVAFDKLSKKDQDYAIAADAKRPDAPSVGKLSASLLPYQEMRKSKVVLPKHRDGMWVRSVENGSPAFTNGLRRLDIIYGIDDTPIRSREDLFWAVKGLEIGKPSKFNIERLESQIKGLEVLPETWVMKTLTIVPQKRSDVEEVVKNAPPLQLGGMLEENSIGVPVVALCGRNHSTKTVVAFVVELHCFDRFNNPVKGFGGIKSNKVSAISQHTIKPDSTMGGSGFLRVTLNGHETASVVKIYLTKVKFDDGSEWNREDGVYMETAKSHE